MNELLKLRKLLNRPYHFQLTDEEEQHAMSVAELIFNEHITKQQAIESITNAFEEYIDNAIKQMQDKRGKEEVHKYYDLANAVANNNISIEEAFESIPSDIKSYFEDFVRTLKFEIQYQEEYDEF